VPTQSAAAASKNKSRLTTEESGQVPLSSALIFCASIFLQSLRNLVAADFACRELANPLTLSFSHDLALEPVQRELVVS
jgi:hypothetical protein